MESPAYHMIKEFAKQLLYNRIFIGNYKESRYVEAVCNYRDVVMVNSSEQLLKQDLVALRERIASNPTFQNKWIGITETENVGTPDRHCIWTDVGNIPFGSYWFQIKSIKLKQNEIFLKLQCLRPLDRETISDKKSKNDSGTPSPSDSVSNADIGFEQIKEKVNEMKNEILSDLFSVLCYTNVKTALWFISVFVFTCVTALLNSVQHIGDFSLKLLRELSVLLRTLTPIILALIDFMAKCVGGFYILISMLFRGGANPPARQFMPQEPLKALPMPKSTHYTPTSATPHSRYRWNPQSNSNNYQQHNANNFR